MSPVPPETSTAFRFARWVTRRHVPVLVVTLLVAVGAGLLARRLELRTAIQELLPNKDPGVVALMRTQSRITNLAPLLVGIRSPDKTANLRYAQAVTERLRALPPTDVSLVAYDVRDLKSFFEKNQWLYLSEDELGQIRDRLRTEIGKRKNPLLVDLSDDESTEDLKKRIAAKRDNLGDRFPDGLFASKDGQFLWVAALPPGNLFVERGGEGLFEAANRIIRELDPKTFHPEMRVEVAGPVASAVATRSAVERDILWVTVSCLTIVAISIGLYFRRLRAIPLVGVPAVVGTIIAFAAAQLAFGYVTSSTAFLGSIILGNGINYAIVFMSRYEEERSRGHGQVPALAIALGGVVPGTAVAALCASAAYASLMLTSFRGFSQFGVMGAIGVVACWVSTFLVLPALLSLLDRRPANEEKRAPIGIDAVAGRIARHPMPLLVFSTVLTLAALVGLRHFLGSPFEYDFRRLNARVASTPEKEAFDSSQDQLFGRWPFPTIVLTDTLEEAELVRKAVRRQDVPVGGKRAIGDIVTIFDVLPGTPDVQQRKLALIGEIRKLVHDPAIEQLPDEDRKELRNLDPPDDLHPLAPRDLPVLARRPFTEVDGTIGRVVLVYPPEKGFSVWNGRDLLRMANAIQQIKLPEEGKEIWTSGNAVVFAAMLRSILRDGPRATVASLVAVMLLLLVILRPWRTALGTLLTLLLGVLWMIGGAGLAEVKITFLNFIALPITFGIGVEYALNVMTRYRERRDMKEAVAATGAAVALCSWTTVVGYGSLLAARNEALRGFGEMAILGEVACLLAAIVAMPAFILWRRGKTKIQEAP